MDILAYGIYGLSDLYRSWTKNTVYSSDDVLKFRSAELRFKLLNGNTLDGFKINFDKQSDALGLYNEIFCNKIYDFKCSELGPRIIDGGANIGMATMRFKQLYPLAKITAFEPQPDVYKLLCKNIEDNDLSFVAPINKALGSGEGTIDFYVSTEGITDCCASIDPVEGEHKKICVDSCKLSSFITGDTDLVKLDIEGSEIDVLVDLEITGKLRFVKNLIIEYHPIRHNQFLVPLLNILDRNGFTCNIVSPYDVSGEMSRYIYKDGLYFFMIYAVPKKQQDRIFDIGAYALKQDTRVVV
jgi:FkbM family methyltransferase